MLVTATCGLGLALPAFAQRPHLEPVVRIGVLDGAPEYTFGDISGVLLLPDNRIVVLDEMAARLRVYDLAGRHLFSFGRSGSGPGEFRAPSSVAFHRDRITVFDRRLQRYSTFSVNGDHLLTARAPDAVGRLASLTPLHGERWLAAKVGGISSEHIAGVAAGRARQVGTGISHIVVFGASAPDTLRSYQEGGLYWYNADTGVPFGGVPGFGDAVIWDTKGDTAVVVIDAVRGRIDWYRAEARELRRTGTVDLALAAISITRAELNQKEQQLREVYPNVRRYGFVTPDFSAHFGKAVLDDRGRVWLERREPEPSNTRRPAAHYLVVSPNGQSFEVTVPARFSLADVEGNLLAGIVRAGSDVQYVQVFRIRR